MIYADVALVLVLAWRFWTDGFGSLDNFANWVEDEWMPTWFRWSARGNWITWVHHALWALLFTAVGAAIGWALGDLVEGARHFSKIAGAYYIVREWAGFWKGRRFTFDGSMDQVGPILIALLLW